MKKFQFSNVKNSYVSEEVFIQLTAGSPEKLLNQGSLKPLTFPGVKM